ncbi:MAG: hypothetical protein H0U55_04415 [Rubrobacteraceae bacterium]|nr:hypothetical protein [Rubrobacteraceae bacterium]
MAEAAQILGISAEAVRGRVRRGTLPVEREGGTVYVLVSWTADDRTTADQFRTTRDRPTDRPQSDSSALISELRAHNATLREQLEAERTANAEMRRIVAGFVQRLPELEAPAPGGRSEARESPETVEEEPEGAGPRSAAEEAQEASEGFAGRDSGTARGSLWRRLFGR